MADHADYGHSYGYPPDSVGDQPDDIEMPETGVCLVCGGEALLRPYGWVHQPPIPGPFDLHRIRITDVVIIMAPSQIDGSETDNG